MSLRLQVGAATGYSNDDKIMTPDHSSFEYYQNEMIIINGIAPIVGAGVQVEVIDNVTLNFDLPPVVATFTASYNF